MKGDRAQDQPTRPPATGQSAVEERILSAFIRVANERGLDGATTRAVAEAAGVNEVTLFRRFHDKASLALGAVRRFSPAEEVNQLDPSIDASRPERTAADLERCLRMLVDNLRAHRGLFQFGVAEARRLPAVNEALTAIPLAYLGYLRRALRDAAPVLRAGVDEEATALQWLGLVTQTRLLIARGAMPELSEATTTRLVKAAVWPVIQWR